MILFEVLLRRHRGLIDRLALDGAEQLVELLFHLGGRILAALDHALRIDPELFEPLQ